MTIAIAIAPKFNPAADFSTGTARNKEGIINALFGALQDHENPLKDAALAFAKALEKEGIPLAVESPSWGECRANSEVSPRYLPQGYEDNPDHVPHRTPGFTGIWRRASAGLDSLLSRANANFAIYKKAPKVMGVCPQEGHEYGDYDIEYQFGIGDELEHGKFTTRHSQWSGRQAKLTGKFRVHVTAGNAPTYQIVIGSLRLWVAGSDGSVTAFRIPTAENRWGDESHPHEFAGYIKRLRELIANECVAMM